MLETAGLDSTVLDAGIAAQQLQLVNAIVDEDRQYATRLTITRTDNENASESVISTVISWLMKKKVLSKEHCDSFREGTYSTPDGWNGTTELEQGKTALASKRNSGVPGCVVWAMELDEQDHRLIYGRWHTRIGIIGNADSCIVNIQLSRYIVRGFIGEAAPPIPSTPRIVKMLFSDEANVVRVGSTFLNDKPIYLTSETLTSKFIPDLTDPNRTLSLILISTDEESKLPVRNLKNLTKQLFGMADIYVLDWHDRALMDTYREVFLKNTPAYDYGMECSSLKIYCKPVDLTVPTDNEMGMAYAKYLIDRYTRYGENRFINVLRQGMSLTDCWVLGILPVPTYVTAGYSINGYIEDLGERIAKEESAGRRAELLADFNELRDCASRAANLPAIFQKYFEGIEKVIVFCPNVFELNEIEKMCPRWFSRVNGNVHTYVVHSSNPFGTSEYDGFKEDDDETAIKLLLCVNQLNEGVHIKGVDAVIMVRRTSSPTIFYQQLGRALTAAGNFEPLVIDLVDNFEMIGIEQIVSMMSESYARLSGENDPEELIPPSAFKVIDHEKDARHLAKNLERRLALRSEKLTIDEKIALWKGL